MLTKKKWATSLAYSRIGWTSSRPTSKAWKKPWETSTTWLLLLPLRRCQHWRRQIEKSRAMQIKTGKTKAKLLISCRKLTRLKSNRPLSTRKLCALTNESTIMEKQSMTSWSRWSLKMPTICTAPTRNTWGAPAMESEGPWLTWTRMRRLRKSAT